MSITFTKRDPDPLATDPISLYDVKHNFTDGTSVLSIHAGDNFDGYKPPSNLIAIMQDNQVLSSIPDSFLDWLTFSE